MFPSTIYVDEGLRFLLTIGRESTDRCFLYACYGNPKIYMCRPYALGATSVFDYPLSSRFDETDSLIVFDNVFVPWEQVFVYRNLEVTFAQFTETPAHQLGNCQAQIRFVSKLQFLAGLAKRLCDVTGNAQDPKIRSGFWDGRSSGHPRSLRLGL